VSEREFCKGLYCWDPYRRYTSEAYCPGNKPNPSKEKVDSAPKVPMTQQRCRLDGAFVGMAVDRDWRGTSLQKHDSSDKLKYVWTSIVVFHFHYCWSCQAIHQCRFLLVVENDAETSTILDFDNLSLSSPGRNEFQHQTQVACISQVSPTPSALSKDFGSLGANYKHRTNLPVRERQPKRRR
jgi:hypothetical protein